MKGGIRPCAYGTINKPAGPARSAAMPRGGRRYAAGGKMNGGIRPCAYGTGSYPLPPHGWQRQILLMPSHRPLTGPCFFKAWTMYSEQVGV